MAKMLLIKRIGELTEEETEALLKNEDIQQLIVGEAVEGEALYYRDILDTVRGSLSSWNIRAYDYNNHIRVNPERWGEFISGLHKMEEYYGFLYPINSKLSRLDFLYNEFITEYEIGSKRFEYVKNIVEDKINELATYIMVSMVEGLEYYSDFSAIMKDGDYVESWLYNNQAVEVAITDYAVTLVNY